MDAFRIAKDDVDEMAAYWMVRKGELLGQTGDYFFALIDPAFAYEDEPDDLMRIQFNICYTEWLLFECRLLGGYTPLMAYVDRPPSSVDTDALDSLREVVRTQFFSRFAILEKRRSSGMATLRDVVDGCCYEVFDPQLCSMDQWKDGTIALRIARVDGVWQTVGQVCMYDRAPEEATRLDGPGCVHEEDAAVRPHLRDMGFYVRFLYDVFSIDGRYHDTLRVRKTDAGAALRREIEEERRASPRGGA